MPYQKFLHAVLLDNELNCFSLIPPDIHTYFKMSLKGAICTQSNCQVFFLLVNYAAQQHRMNIHLVAVQIHNFPITCPEPSASGEFHCTLVMTLFQSHIIIHNFEPLPVPIIFTGIVQEERGIHDGDDDYADDSFINHNYKLIKECEITLICS